MILLEKHIAGKNTCLEISINPKLISEKRNFTCNSSPDPCKCSYCYGNSKLYYGLNIPKNKSWNSWWVIKFWPHIYLRFTLPFLKKKK